MSIFPSLYPIKVNILGAEIQPYASHSLVTRFKTKTIPPENTQKMRYHKEGSPIFEKVNPFMSKMVLSTPCSQCKPFPPFLGNHQMQPGNCGLTKRAHGSSSLFSNQLRELHRACSPTGSRFGPQIKGFGKHRETHFPQLLPGKLKGEIAPVKCLCSQMRGQDYNGESTPVNLQLVWKSLASSGRCCLPGVLSCHVASLFLCLSNLKACRALLQSLLQ